MFRLFKRRQKTTPLVNALGFFCLCAALITGAPASAQDAKPSNADKDTEAITQFRADLETMQKFLQNEIAALQKFAEWTEYLSGLADSNPHAALSQRLPMAACKSTSLAPDCEKMRALFLQYLGIVPARNFHLRYSPER